jgi:phospholipid transport system substrate-binding protein
MRIRQILPAALMALCMMTLPAAAAADVAGAQSFVEREHGQLKRLVEANASVGQVQAVLDGMVDYDELARRTLGKPCPATIPKCTNHWDTLTPEQQREVTSLLRRLVEKNYRKNLMKTRDYEISYRGARDQGENLSKIRTEAKSKAKPRDPAVQVDYLIMGASNRYKVIDIVTEGSSMTKNYYDQFHRMLTTPGQGYPYLVKKLKAKIAAKPKRGT